MQNDESCEGSSSLLSPCPQEVESDVQSSNRSVGATSVLSRIETASQGLAIYCEASEDDGFILKTGVCTSAWYALEAELKNATEDIREGKMRPEETLKDAIQNGKKLLEEVSLRVMVYDASMASVQATFASTRAELDTEKLKAHHGLTYTIQRLSRVLARTPNRFVAANRDLQSARRALEDLDASWKEDLLERVARRPHWVPNEFTEKCTSCRKSFGVLRSKHHCRACGLVFCDSCTSYLLSLPKLAYFSRRRVCKDCYLRHGRFSVRQNGVALEEGLDLIFPDCGEWT